MIRVLTLVALGAALAAASVAAQPPSPAAPAPGYLSPSTWPDAAVILPAPPQTGSEREARDQRIFRQTRSLEGSPRWGLAQNDIPTDVPSMMKNFSCALGLGLDPQNAPATAKLLAQTGRDAGRQVASVKDVFKRKRPYLIEDGPTCVAKTDSLAASPDYPSGHSTWGWAAALILAELAPDRATPVLARGRAFGESRIVCGVHSASAVEAGRTNGGALVAALHGLPQFRADLEAARSEVASLRASPAAAQPACAAEAGLVTQALY